MTSGTTSPRQKATKKKKGRHVSVRWKKEKGMSEEYVGSINGVECMYITVEYVADTILVLNIDKFAKRNRKRRKIKLSQMKVFGISLQKLKKIAFKIYQAL